MSYAKECTSVNGNIGRAPGCCKERKVRCLRLLDSGACIQRQRLDIGCGATQSPSNVLRAAKTPNQPMYQFMTPDRMGSLSGKLT